jgi:serine protease Do
MKNFTKLLLSTVVFSAFCLETKAMASKPKAPQTIEAKEEKKGKALEASPSEAKEEKKEEPTPTESKSGETESTPPAVQPAPPTETQRATSTIDLQVGLNPIVEKVLPSVVNIATTQLIEQKGPGAEMPRFAPGSPFEELFRDFFDQMDNQKPRKVQSLGSGFVIKIDGSNIYVVTNNHVVADAKKITIMFHNKVELDATLHAADERTDIAVLKADISAVSEDKKPRALNWANSDAAKVGDFVGAVGNAYGLQGTFTFGVISSLGRDLMTKSSQYVDDFIQHSAPINMGNSGGCLINMNAEVLGINTAIFSPSGGNVGIGFAIPSAVARATVDQLIEFGRTKRGWLGLRIQQMTDAMAESLGLKVKGPLVGSVTPEGPADKGGIKGGDIILEFDGIQLNDNNRITRLVGETPIGKKVKVKVWRDGKEKELEVVIGEFEEAEAKGHIDGEPKEDSSAHKQSAGVFLGMRLGPVPAEVRQRLNQKSDKGIFVERVDPQSTAAESGIARGDIILEANRKTLSSVKEFENALEEAKKSGRKNIFLLVTRNNEPRFTAVRIEDEEEKK